MPRCVAEHVADESGEGRDLDPRGERVAGEEEEVDHLETLPSLCLAGLCVCTCVYQLHVQTDQALTPQSIT